MITQNTPEHLMTEDEFIAQYNMKDYASVSATVDLLIFTIRDEQLQLLLIERGGHPELGKLALPGGFVNTDESLDQAAERELMEETGVSVSGYLEQLKTYGNPNRDRRGFVISTAYVALIPHVADPEAADDAASADFYPVSEILGELRDNLAFDHAEIIEDGLARVRAKIEYAPVASEFIDSESFTMSELRRVYEIVWGVELLPSNFRRKVQSVPGLVEPTGEKRRTSADGGRTSDLYVAGSAKEIYPPLRQA